MRPTRQQYQGCFGMFKKRIVFGLLGLGATCGAILLAVVVGGVLFGSLGAASSQGRGDLNGDGVVTFADAPPFVVALRDPAAWQRRHHRTWRELLRVADFNADGDVSRFDIAGFSDLMRALLGGGGGSQASGGGGGDDGLGFADLDVDSDNNNATNQPARTAFEDTIEDDPAQPGKFVLVNDDDDDRDGTPDKDQNGTIQAERDDLVPLVLEIVPDASVQPVVTSLDYRLTYPANARLWRSATRGDLGTDVVVSGVTYQQVVWILGDMNGDGFFNGADIDPFFLALGDPAAFALQFPNVDAAAVGDMNGDGLFNGADIDPFFAALGLGTVSYVPVRMWIEGLDPSASMADTRFVADADTDNNGSLDGTDAVRTTIFSLTASPTSGPVGTEVTWTLDPAIAPVAFDPSTTAQWDGHYQLLVGPPTSAFSASYSATQVRESSPTQAVLVVGDGTLTNAPDPTDLDGGGTLVGDQSFQFGSIPVKRAFDFTPETDGAVWEQVDYPDGPGGAVPPVLDGEWPELPLMLLSLAPDPNNPSEDMLLRASGFHLSAVVRIDENPTSGANAPATILVDLVSYDDTGVELDRLENVVLQKLIPDGEPNNIVYHNDLSVPIVPVDVDLNKANYPNVLLLRGFDGGSAVIIAKAN